MRAKPVKFANPALKRIAPWAGTAYGPDAFGGVIRHWIDEEFEITKFLFTEHTFVTARTFRSGGTWTIQAQPGGESIEV